MNYFEHQHNALQIWLLHYDVCADRNKCYDQQERTWAIESFYECEQLKFLDDGSIKVKWEHPCWWADCKSRVFHGNYYCILAPLHEITWYEPFELARKRRGIDFEEE
jgi:hypothetical protein